MSFTLYRLSDDNYVVAQGNKAIFFNEQPIQNGMPIRTWNCINDTLFEPETPLKEGDSIIIKGTEDQYETWGFQRAPTVVQAAPLDIRSAMEIVLDAAKIREENDIQ